LNDQIEEGEMGKEYNMFERRNAYKVLVGNPERDRLLGRQT
jgi:hypothetical protein